MKNFINAEFYENLQKIHLTIYETKTGRPGHQVNAQSMQKRYTAKPVTPYW